MCATRVNGVSKLHSEIIKQSVFHDYLPVQPRKIHQRDQRHRLPPLAAGQSNPGLTGLLEDTIGAGFKKDASELKKLAKFKDGQTSARAVWTRSRTHNKVIFAEHLKKRHRAGDSTRTHCSTCRSSGMHEYKRQHLNALNIAAQYLYHARTTPTRTWCPKPISSEPRPRRATIWPSR